MPRPHIGMSDAYDNLVGGSLRLKGIGKKKKKKDKEDPAAQAAAAAVTAAASAAGPSSASGTVSGFGSGHTASELRRLETVASRQIKALETGKVKSHREKVKDFNSYLANLTEHYDLPKVRSVLRAPDARRQQQQKQQQQQQLRRTHAARSAPSAPSTRAAPWAQRCATLALLNGAVRLSPAQVSKGN